MLTEIKLKPGESEKLLWKIAEKKLPGCKYVKILKNHWTREIKMKSAGSIRYRQKERCRGKREEHIRR